MNQRTALVTGGARGIGRGISLELARAGASVVVADLDLSQSAKVVEEIRALGREGLAVRLDVTEAALVRQCVEEAIKRFGRVDILVNNAGIFQSRIGFDQSDEDFNRCLDVNLTGMWRMARALVPHFKSNGGGRIINVSSVGGRLASDFAAGYCASKAGVISLTQSLAMSLGADNINVNTVCPGAVATAMQDEIKSLRGQLVVESNKQSFSAPLATPLTANDIGHAVVFFASDCARSITGQALNVDCGYLMN